MKIKTSTLIGIQLDWVVAKALKVKVGVCLGGYLAESKSIESTPYSAKKYSPSTDWAQGGPIIEQENLEIGRTATEWRVQRCDFPCVAYGPTPLIAAMHCYVASKLGDEVEIPDELC